MTGVKISTDILKLAATIYAVVQAIKKSPWIEGVLEKIGGKWVPIGLAVLTASVGGFLEFGADGTITLVECGQIIAALVAAMGLHTVLSAVENK